MLVYQLLQLKLSKEIVAPQEPIRAFIKTENGDSFSFSSMGANLAATQPDGRIQGNEVREWTLDSPVQSVDMTFPESGDDIVKVTGVNHIFGISLPPRSATKTVKVVANDKISNPISAPLGQADPSILAASPTVTIKLLSKRGELPAEVSVTSTVPGSMEFSGQDSAISEAGVPVKNFRALKSLGFIVRNSQVRMAIPKNIS